MEGHAGDAPHEAADRRQAASGAQSARTRVGARGAVRDARGLTTGPMSSGGRIFGVDADFVAHRVRITTAAGETRHVALAARPVAAFYKEFTAALVGLGIQ